MKLRHTAHRRRHAHTPGLKPLPAKHHPPPPEDVPTRFVSSESSNISGADYDAGTLTLTVEFCRRPSEESSRRYRYTPVPPSCWLGFVQAPSKGTFFAQRIRPLYEGERL